MPDPRPFAYTILRLVPRIERGECMNVGVVLFCRQLRFLDARIQLDQDRLRALSTELDPGEVRPHLEAIRAVVCAQPDAGPLARLPASERFGWVAARSSTIIQASDVHTGLTADPAAALKRLFNTLVAVCARP